MSLPMDEKDRMEPCPFCGAPAFIDPNPFNGRYWQMCHKDDCYLRQGMPNPVLITDEVMWNTRQRDKDIAEAVGIIKDLLDELKWQSTNNVANVDVNAFLAKHKDPGITEVRRTE